jgi:threonine dehydratase
MPAPPARILIPCGGCGLASGIALACPDSEIVIVEPDGWDDMRHSLECGVIVPVSSDAPPTLCDALQTPRVSTITLGILRDARATAVTASEDAVRAAVRWAWDKHKLVVEPGGAIALAALLSGAVGPAEGTVIVLSGGNVDPALHARILSEA